MSDLILAVSAKAATQLFNQVRNTFTFSKSGSGSWGPFSASYSIALHLSGGTFTLNNNNTVEIQNLEIVWDTLSAQVCFNLPQVCVGGWCIVPTPWGCAVRLPKLCTPGSLCIGPDLIGIVDSKVEEIDAGVVTKYFVSPQRTPGQSDLDAEFAGYSNQWQIYLNPTYVLVDPIDFGPTIDNIIEQALNDALASALSFLPSWAVDLIMDILGPVLQLIADAIGIVGDIGEWFQSLFNNLFGIPALIETAIAQYFANEYPIWSFEDPYPILPSSGGLIPVKIPIRNLQLTIDSAEMVAQANIGA